VEREIAEQRESDRLLGVARKEEVVEPPKAIPTGLREPVLERRIPPLPIDHFLRSLARDQEQRAVGVILSGMGSDGTLGLRAIKEKAGLVLVQEPASAKFDSMPRHAIAAGASDIVLTPEKMPAALLNYVILGTLLGRQHAGLALALQNLLWGLGQPVAGAMNSQAPSRQ